MLGTIITTALYILGTIVLFGILPLNILQNSPAPFADQARLGLAVRQVPGLKDFRRKYGPLANQDLVDQVLID